MLDGAEVGTVGPEEGCEKGLVMGLGVRARLRRRVNVGAGSI